MIKAVENPYAHTIRASLLLRVHSTECVLYVCIFSVIVHSNRAEHQSFLLLWRHFWFIWRETAVCSCCTNVHAHTHTHTSLHICQWQTAPFNILTPVRSLSGSVSQRLNRFTALKSSCTENSLNASVDGNESHIPSLDYTKLYTGISLDVMTCCPNNSSRFILSQTGKSRPVSNYQQSNQA